jgi:hypothetical protein
MRIEDVVLKDQTPAEIPLSVVVVVLEGQTALSRCLTALTQQVGVPRPEMIVPCDASFGDSSALRVAFPDVSFLNVEGHHRTYAELRALGVHKARGAIVALTEDHCTPRPDWCRNILEAHSNAHDVVGGAVDKEGPDTAVNWALYLADYVRYMNPVLEGSCNTLTDCNVSYKRAVLETVVEVWTEEFHEPAVHGALQASGMSLWLSPRIVVHQQRHSRLMDALKDRYAFGRLFGSTRVMGTPFLRRITYAGCALLLPPLLISRIAAHVVRTRRCTKAFVYALPALGLLTMAWSWGELMGYLTRRPEKSLRPGRQPNRPASQQGQVATT